MLKVRAAAPVLALVGWTLFVWSTRVRNAAEDAGLSTTTRLGAFALAGLLIVFAVASAVAVFAGWSTRIIQVFAVITVAVWAIRVPQILAADHSAGFKAVHVLLGSVSIVLALGALRWAARQGDRADTVAALDGSC